jgi:hypothetical protein
VKKGDLHNSEDLLLGKPQYLKMHQVLKVGTG